MTRSNPEFEAGMAMLADPAAAPDWRRAVELIDAAAGAGHAGAIERRALFECMGIARPGNWEKALDSLAEAASLGSKRASGQLETLAGTRGSDEDWSAVRARVRIAERLRSPAPRTLSSNPLIRVVDGFADAAECRWLIDAAAPRLERAIVHSNKTGQPGVDPGRTNQFALFPLVELDVVVELVRARIAAAIGAPLPCLEVSQVLSYAVGEEFAPHHDYLDPASMAREIAQRGQRAVTALIYLNDGFKGGETRFGRIGIEFRGSTGDALIFSNVDPTGRPDPRTEHAGCPPTSGEKWVFSQWVRDRLPA